jgi:hypothetical protein
MLPTDQNESRPNYQSLAQIAGRVAPNKGSKPVHVATLTRWILEGCRAKDGSRIRLRAVRFPAGWRTTDEWFAEFVDAITRDHTGEPEVRPQTIQTSAQRRRELERVDRELARSGF